MMMVRRIQMTLGWAETFEEFASDIFRKVEHGWDLVLSRSWFAWSQIVRNCTILVVLSPDDIDLEVDSAFNSDDWFMLA